MIKIGIINLGINNIKSIAGACNTIGDAYLINCHSDVEKYTEYQDTFEHLFIILMGILMIVIFSPHGKGPTCVDGHSKVFLYVFGILSVLGIIKNFKNKEN